MGLRKKLRKLMGSHHADTPWTDSMTDKSRPQDASPNKGAPPNPTVAAFSPNQQTASRTRNKSSILIHQKSPLLVATPPQVTRALAYSHPFILPLNHFAGLLSWTTGDPWESFLLVPGFWFAVLYGGIVIRWAGPLLVVVAMILAMYSRRYSPLSSTVWSGEKTKRARADSEGRKSLDEILETLQTFTGRCDVLLDPFLAVTEFLSTQSSATSATTRPALTTLFIRIVGLTPIWILLTSPPFYIITPKSAVLALGTVGLTWHSRPARITRTLLWRSRTVRHLSSVLTGLAFVDSAPKTTTTAAPALPPRRSGAATALQTTKGTSPGVRFTFTIYENQRRWIGLGWTANLLTYERQAWTDEHLNICPEPKQFELPETDHETTKWRWVPGSEWHVEGALTNKERSAKRIGGGGGGDDCGWTYYDSKWHDGRKVDGWGRYTRRRKWMRDAELDDDGVTSKLAAPQAGAESTAISLESGVAEPAGVDSTAKRKGWLAGGKQPRRGTNDRSDALSNTGSANTSETARSREGNEDDLHTPLRYRQTDWDRSIGDGVAMGLS